MKGAAAGVTLLKAPVLSIGPTCPSCPENIIFLSKPNCLFRLSIYLDMSIGRDIHFLGHFKGMSRTACMHLNVNLIKYSSFKTHLLFNQNNLFWSKFKFWNNICFWLFEMSGYLVFHGGTSGGGGNEAVKRPLNIAFPAKIFLLIISKVFVPFLQKYFSW